VYRDDPDYENDPESDPFKKLRSMMKLEQEKNRKFKVRMVQQKSDLLHILTEQHKLGVPLAKVK